MNYIKQINGFYSRLEYESLTANEISLWQGLMNICNRTGWQNEFKASNDVLKSKSGLSISSLQRARNVLVQKDLIIYKKGTNRKNSI